MRRYLRCLLVLLVLAAGCGAVESAPDLADPTAGVAEAEAEATPLPLATPTMDVVTPEMVGRGFLDAWQVGDYAQMYQLLTPSRRETLTIESFQEAYEVPLHTTTAISITVVPQALNIDGARAWIEFREVWHTALFGDLQANNTVNLALEGDQWWVDWDRAAIWPDLAQGNRFVIEYQIPTRANIYDHEGAGLAVPGTIVTVGVIPGQIEDEVLLLDTLSKVLGMTYEQVQERYADQPADWYVPIGDISGEDSLAWDTALSIPGIERRERIGRLYPLDGVGSSAVGWISPVPAESYQAYRNRGYRGDERVGIAGLEAWGESILAGRNGARLYLVADDGTYVGGMAERAPIRGRAVYATLDRDLQHAAEVALGARRGAVVALDVRTGAVRALASGPHYDNNIFVRPTDDWRRQAVLYDANQPLLNRALQGQYPAGSVFKIVTMAAALGPGGIDAQSPYNCPGYWDGLGVANRKMCWLETGHGDIVLKDGLTASCNVVFYEVGSRLHNQDPTTLPAYGTAFGLGQETGLEELPEEAGLIPDPDWKWSTYRENWGTGDTVNMAIGQGFVLVTPIQIARMVAAVANGGTLYRPYLVDRIAGDEMTPETVTSPEPLNYLPVSEAHLNIIRDAMLGVTTNTAIGTATHRFSGLGIPVAGKTGTAEPGQEGAVPHSWFAGYFPADAPEIAMVVLVENAGEGSTVAAPMFRQIVEGYHGLPITPLPTPPAPSE